MFCDQVIAYKGELLPCQFWNFVVWAHLQSKSLGILCNLAVNVVLQGGFAFAFPEVPVNSLARDQFNEISQYHDF